MTQLTGPSRRLTDPPRPSKRNLELATNLLRQPGATLVRAYAGGNPQYRIFPDGRLVPEAVATRLIALPDIRGQGDGLFPGLDQSWRLQAN
jgi:hypothetical protein